MSEKVTGYTLLTVGLITIVLVSFNAYQVFTKQLPPIHYFSLPPITLNTSAFLPSQLQGQTASAPTLELLSGQTSSDMANLTIHLVLASFLVGVASKVAGLGVQLLRPIEVKLNSK